MTAPPSRVLTTAGVLLGALAGAAAASVLYGVLDANGFGVSMFRSRLVMLLVGVGMLPFFTLGGAIVGGLVIRRFGPRFLARADKSSSSAP
jgi:hypothetical protein